MASSIPEFAEGLNFQVFFRTARLPHDCMPLPTKFKVVIEPLGRKLDTHPARLVRLIALICIINVQQKMHHPMLI